MRSALLAAFACVGAAFVPVAMAEPVPIDGAMQFQAIQGPDGPEEFVWEVDLGLDQELRQVDDRHAEVVYVDSDTIAFPIAAVDAHDATGTAVPTTLAVTQPNLVILTVHHRGGNPAAGGAPFDYPVVAGAGWEGGFQTYPIAMPDGGPAWAPVRCSVPDLAGRTLRASRKILHRAHCKLGPVRGERNRAARVLRQYRPAGKSLPVWTAVGVKVS